MTTQQRATQVMRDTEALATMRYNENVKRNFVKLARSCKSGCDFYSKVKVITEVPLEVSIWFRETYKLDTPILACNAFFNDVQEGKY